MLTIVMMLAIQAEAPAPAPVPQRFSILAPTCRRTPGDPDIVVCDRADDSVRLPLPDERGPPDHGVPSNPNGTGVGALAVASTPCATLQGGCQVGFGPPIIPIVKAAAGLVKSALAKKPDKSGRVPIPLEDPPLPPSNPSRASLEDMHP